MPSDRLPRLQNLSSERLLDLVARQRPCRTAARLGCLCQERWQRSTVSTPGNYTASPRGRIARRPPSVRTTFRRLCGCISGWLGHILRTPADRLVRRAVLALGQRAGPPYQPGSLLMDTPPPPLHELVLRTAEDGHEITDSSPPYRKAPKGCNSTELLLSSA